jgi:hypothetical protein
VPLSVVKGGTAANLLVRGLESDWMRDTTVNTLVTVSAALNHSWLAGHCQCHYVRLSTLWANVVSPCRP